MKKRFNITITFGDAAIPPKGLVYTGTLHNAHKVGETLQKFWRRVIDGKCAVIKEVKEVER